jgi:hypothetical protein
VENKELFLKIGAAIIRKRKHSDFSFFPQSQKQALDLCICRKTIVDPKKAVEKENRKDKKMKRTKETFSSVCFPYAVENSVDSVEKL